MFVEFSLALDATVYCPKKMLLSLERIRSSRAFQILFEKEDSVLRLG